MISTDSSELNSAYDVQNFNHSTEIRIIDQPQDQPQDVYANIGDIISLKAVVTVTEASLNYQWYDKYGAPIYTANAPELKLGPITEEFYGFYKLRIINQFGQEQLSRWCEVAKPVQTRHNTVAPTVNELPTIIQEVEGGTFREYSNIELKVEMKNAMYFQWYKDGCQLLSCTGDNLTIWQARGHNKGIYIVMGANEFGYTASKPASVHIQLSGK